MPLRDRTQPATTGLAPRSGPDQPRARFESATPETEGVNPLAVAGGAAGIGALAVLAKTGKLGKVASGLNALRQQLMLSGLALPKSLLGNAGAAVEASIERRSLRPLKEMFSRQTVSDAVRAFKANAGQPGVTATGPRQATLPGPMPGRFMGAFDEAAQGALRRAGLSADEAQASVLQAPLQGDLAEALDSPLARYIHPFRRTPFNQFLEGLKRLPTGRGGSTLGKSVYMGTGAAHGAATADDEAPLSIPLAMAASSRYGLPYGLAALLGRQLAGGKGDADIASGLIPVSEYGVTSAVQDPLRPFRKPAALTALEKLTGGS